MKRQLVALIAISTLLGTSSGFAKDKDKDKDKDDKNSSSKVTATQCKEVTAKLKPHGHACNEIKEFKERGSCFDNAPKKAGIKADLLKACGELGHLDALKNDLIAEEQKKYPKQPETYDKKVPSIAVAAPNKKLDLAPTAPAGISPVLVKAPEKVTLPAPVSSAPKVATTSTPINTAVAAIEAPNTAPSLIPGLAIAAAHNTPSVVPTTTATLPALVPVAAAPVAPAVIPIAAAVSAPAVVPVAASAPAVIPVAAAPAPAIVPVAATAPAAVPIAAAAPAAPVAAAAAPAVVPAGPYQWPASQCNTSLTKFKTMGNRCLASTDFNARNNCFNSANSSMPSGFLTNCSLSIGPVKAQLMADEKSRYPTQQNAVH